MPWGLLEQREHGANYEGGDGGGGEARVSQRAAGSATGGGEDDAVQAAPPLAAEAAGGSTPQTEPGPAGNTKQDKERLRKERQRQRKVEVAVKALQWAMEAIAEHGVRCVHSHEASRRLRISVHYTRATY